MPQLVWLCGFFAIVYVYGMFLVVLRMGEERPEGRLECPTENAYRWERTKQRLDIVITIRESGEVALGELYVAERHDKSLLELSHRINGKFPKSPLWIAVLIECDPQSTYERIIDVINMLTRSGIQDYLLTSIKSEQPSR